MPEFEIFVSNEQEILPVDTDRLEEKAKSMLLSAIKNPDVYKKSTLVGLDPKELTVEFDVLVCDDEKIHDYNMIYRGKDKPTDVLSFALFADTDERMMFNNHVPLGEIIISSQTAAKQAEENGKQFDDEMDFLLAHGILHLLGFDHQDEESYEYMIGLQNDLLAKV